MPKVSMYYNCCNANDKELASEAEFLRKICPPFVSLPKLFQVVWEQRRAGPTEGMRLDTIHRVKTILEGLNAVHNPRRNPEEGSEACG